jgi:tricorn protease
MVRRLLASAIYAALACSLCFAQAKQPMPFQSPAVSRTHIAFVYAGSVWLVDRKGGEARRLTTEPGDEGSPFFSPDGSQVAFSKNVGGNTDVYVIPTAGGPARRLTYHPKGDTVAGWTPDGKSVVFSSWRVADFLDRLYTIPAQGGFETELPLPQAWEGSYSPDGSHIAYIQARALQTWRNYRGGRATAIWIARLADSQAEEVPRSNSNDFDPMWVGDTIYFVSDRTNTANLFGYDTKTRKITQLTKYEKYDIKSASATDDAIVFAQGGAINLYDLKSNQSSAVDVRITGDFPEVKQRAAKVARSIRWYDLSPTGSHAVFGARGEVLTLSADKGEARNLTQTSGAAERLPAWSPDGRWIAYFSDESGEYELHVRPADGQGQTRRISIEKNPSYYEEPVWSPDSKKLAFSDKRLTLWYVDLDKGAARQVDSSTFAGQGQFYPAWSPDGRWLAYSRHLPNRLRTLFLYSIDAQKSYPVTSSRSDAEISAFDKSGKYLYFTMSNTAGPSKIFGMTVFPFRSGLVRRVYAVVLQKDGVSPLAPTSAEEQPAAGAAPSGVDVEHIADRVVPLPIPAGDYTGLAAGKSGVLFLMERLWPAGAAEGGQPTVTLHRFDVSSRKAEKFMEGVSNFTVSSDGGRVIYHRGQNYAVVSADAPPKAEDGRLAVANLEVSVDPRAEWKQMMNEAWRIQREFFYDAGLHGQNIAALKEHYSAYLPGVVTRNDLNYVLRDMLSHMQISHMGVGGGDAPPQGNADVGLLGADYKIEQGRYRISRIYRGDNSEPILTAPLAQIGVDVREGDYLLAVDGQEVKATENLYSYFVSKSGKQVRLTVGPNADGSRSRTVTVRPIPGENTLRTYTWIEENRRKVDEMSEGKLGYIYLIDTGFTGYLAFNRDFYAQVDKQGLIIDERFNGGGAPADYFIETLRRAPLSYYAFREGDDFPFPMGTVAGPKVMIINEQAGSGGDTLPWMFRQAGLGPLVGKRTMGAGIGGFLNIPELIDGGRVGSPNRAFYNPKKGVWDIENAGVPPDIEVDLTPADWRAGRDPQLEKAVQVALEELKKNPPARPKRPKYPVYK